MKSFFKMLLILNFANNCSLKSADCKSKFELEMKFRQDSQTPNFTELERAFKLQNWEYLKKEYYFQKIKTYDLRYSRVSSLCPLPDNNLVISYFTSDFRYIIDIFNLENKRILSSKSVKDFYSALLFIDKLTLVGGTPYGAIKYIDIDPRNLFFRSESNDYKAITASLNKIIDFNPLPDGNVCVIYKSCIKIYDSQFKSLIRIINHNKIDPLVCMPSSKIAVLYCDNLFEIFDVTNDHTCLKKIEFRDYVFTAICPLTKSIVALGTDGGKIILLDLISATSIDTLEAEFDETDAVAIDYIKLRPNGNLLSYSHANKKLKLWALGISDSAKIDYCHDALLNENLLSHKNKKLKLWALGISDSVKKIDDCHYELLQDETDNIDQNQKSCKCCCVIQ